MTEAPRQDEDDDDDHPYTIKRRKRVFLWIPLYQEFAVRVLIKLITEKQKNCHY